LLLLLLLLLRLLRVERRVTSTAIQSWRIGEGERLILWATLALLISCLITIDPNSSKLGRSHLTSTSNNPRR